MNTILLLFFIMQTIWLNADSMILKEVDKMPRDQKEKFIEYYEARLKEQEKLENEKILAQRDVMMNQDCYATINTIYNEFLEKKRVLKKSLEDEHTKLYAEAVYAANKLKNIQNTNVSQHVYSLYLDRELKWDKLYDFEQDSHQQYLELHHAFLKKARAVKQRWLETLKNK
ncbi:MAG: hypothetical protein ACRCVW_01460 [Brevinema sp.]